VTPFDNSKTSKDIVYKDTEGNACTSGVGIGRRRARVNAIIVRFLSFDDRIHKKIMNSTDSGYSETMLEIGKQLTVDHLLEAQDGRTQ